ncbi:MAG: uracil-DNA glycosylase [Beijerinckiaceae bacterium]|nr:MAG: uracil-DNA glycosylase [Beijerinckiaceae bacterium]
MPIADETSPDASALAQLLRWYADMGVDAAIDAAAHDRFAETAAAKTAIREQIHEPRPPRPPATRQPPTAAPHKAKPVVAPLAADVVVQSAAEAAASAQNLDELRAKLLAFDGCGLKATATQLVFADGNPEAPIMFVGEAPGADEDRIGRPFVGRAGQLLDKMLAAIELDRSKVYIANIVPWRPPGNRTPTPLEAAACLPFLRRQIALVNPKILICLGKPSCHTLLPTKDSMMRLHGRWFDYDVDGFTILALAMLHPAYLLRTPAQKGLAWADLRALAKKMKTLGINF